MSLVTNELFGTHDKVALAVEILREFEPPEGYWVAFSGGKDSIVIKQLAIEAEVKFEAHHNFTTIDPPELVYFIRDHHRDVFVDMPKKPFLHRLVEKGFPQRQRRWCCEEYKEGGGEGRFVITGIRAQESSKRAGRHLVETCYRHAGKRYLNIIIGWSEDDVWEFIKSRNLPYPKLYDQGWKRIGCLFCPYAGKHRQVERKLYPKQEQAWRRAFQRLYEKNKDRPSYSRWGSGDEMFDWWIAEEDTSVDPDQGIMFE